MQKFHIRRILIIGLMLWLASSELVDAAPRNRRRARRARAAATSRNYRPARRVVYQGDTSSIASQVTAEQATSAEAEPRPLDVGDALPLDPDLEQDDQVVAASHTEATSDADAVATEVLKPVTIGAALAEVNSIRTQRGLHAFIEDESLSAVAHKKASIQANRGWMGHPGGSMGGARYEGVGVGNRFISCYLYSNVGRYAGAASVVGRNGQRYHCLLIR